MLQLNTDTLTSVDINYKDGSNELLELSSYEGGEILLERLDNLYYGDCKVGLVDNFVFHGDDELEVVDAADYYKERLQGFTFSSHVQQLRGVLATGSILGNQW